jgi:fumarylpyruvate hydrolase
MKGDALMNYVFTPENLPSVPVRGSQLHYAVSRIFCVGRNYAAHAREMGFDPDREPPFYFTKPANALVLSGATIPYALGTKNLHYEMELVIAISKPAFRVSVENAQDHIYGYACGLDMTRRDLQIKSREIGRPWDFGKAFEDSAVITPLVPKSEIGLLNAGNIDFTVNGQIKQKADLKDMIWSVAEIIANLSEYYHLNTGDLIYTGTPEGVGPVVPGDHLVGTIDGLGTLELHIGPEQ